MQTPYGPMYALTTLCEKQAKDEAAGDASLLPQNNKLLGLEGAHNHVHGWVKSTGNVKTVREKSLKTVVFWSICFVLWGVKPNQHVFLTHVKGAVG